MPIIQSGWQVKPAATSGLLQNRRQAAIKLGMCFHATTCGAIVPVWSKTTYDEVMLHCARIGFKP